MPTFAEALLGATRSPVYQAIRQRHPADQDMEDDERLLQAQQRQQSVANADTGQEGFSIGGALRTTGGATLSGLGAVGNILDIPASMIRDVMTWLPGGIPAQNPFDQLLSPMRPENRVIGEQILRLDKWEPESTLGSVGKFAAGVGTEILLDPLTYLTGGATAAGKIAKLAGVSREASKIATTRAGYKVGEKVVGPRVARQQTTLRDILKATPGKEDKLALYDRYKLAADATGQKLDKDLLDMPLGGLRGYKLPFMRERILTDQKLNELVAKGTTKLPASLKAKYPNLANDLDLGKKLDFLGNAITYGQRSPVRAAARYVDPRVRGLSEPEAQRAARASYESEQAQKVYARDRMYQAVKAVEDSSIYRRRSGESEAAAATRILSNSLAIDDYMEGVSTQLPNEVRQAGLKKHLDVMRNLLEEEAETAVASGRTDHTLGPLQGIKAKVKPRSWDDLEQLTGEELESWTAAAQKATKDFGVDYEDIFDEDLFDPELIPAARELDVRPNLGYLTRARQVVGGPLRAARMSRRMIQGDPNARARLEHFRIYPKSDIQRMSVDTTYAGAMDRGAFGTKRHSWLRPDRSQGQFELGRGGAPVDKELKEELWKQFQEDYPLRLDLFDEEVLTDEVQEYLGKQQRALFESIVNLDYRQAERGIPMFGVNQMEDVMRRLETGFASSASTRNTLRFMAASAKHSGEKVDDATHANFYAALKDMELNNQGAMENVVEALRQENPQRMQAAFDAEKAALAKSRKVEVDEIADADVPLQKILENYRIDNRIASDVLRVNRIASTPEEVSDIGAAWDALTNMFKSNVTAPFPAFHVRNAASAFTQNLLNGVTDPTVARHLRYIQPYRDAIKLVRGDQTIEGIENWAYFKGRGLTAEEATDELREMIYARKLVDAPGDHRDLLRNQTGRSAEAIPGQVSYRQRAAAPEGTTIGETLNPLKVAGGTAAEDKFFGARYGRAAGDMIEQTVRSAPFIAFLKQGMDPDVAARKVKRLQVDYSDLTPFERKYVRRAIPFYAFQKGAAKHLAQELMERPGGPTAQAIRAANRTSRSDQATPDYIQAGLSVPLGRSADGGRTYLSSMGLMHEAPLAMFPTGVQSGLFNIGSMLHPGAKLPLEVMFDESLFQEAGRSGGRPLSQQDPLLGRTLSNIMSVGPLPDQENPVRIGKLPEAVIANSPAARYLSTVRKLTDPRRGVLDKSANLLTGMRTAIVSPQVEDAIVRERVNDLMEELGARSFTNRFFPESVRSSMSPAQLERAEQLEQIRSYLLARQKRRRSQADASDTE